VFPAGLSLFIPSVSNNAQLVWKEEEEEEEERKTREREREQVDSLEEFE
jgi:hypothetical protein